MVWGEFSSYFVDGLPPGVVLIQGVGEWIISVIRLSNYGGDMEINGAGLLLTSFLTNWSITITGQTLWSPSMV